MNEELNIEWLENAVKFMSPLQNIRIPVGVMAILLERLRVAEKRAEIIAKGYESGMASTKGKEFTAMLHYSNAKDGEAAWEALTDMIDEDIARKDEGNEK